MTYYKIILNNNIIGIASSNDFIAFSPVIESFLRSDEKRGEFVNWRGNIYRDTWMAPVQFQIDFIQAQIHEISEEEYNSYQQAFEINDIIEYEREEQEPIEDPIEINPIDESSLEFIRSSKIAEMSRACRLAIEAGFDLELRGEIRHFSLTTQDQLNLMSLGAIAQTQQLIPYHADGEICEFYTADEINRIISAAATLKNYNTVYYNSLKTYINMLETIEEVSAITYGTPIPEEYKSDVLKVLEY